MQNRYNPDVLSCLANLSNDEVFTLPQVVNRMLDMLPPELWSNPHNLVFTDGTGKHMAVYTFYRHFKKIAAQIGRPDARPHDLRHTAATVAIASGADIKSVQDLMGHATASFTLNVYAHTSDQMKRDTAARMQSYYDGLTAQKQA